MGYVSLMSAMLIISFSFLVIRLYWPIGMGRWSYRHGELGAEIYFAHGVVMGFLAALVNALFWKVTIRVMWYLDKNPAPLLQWGDLFDVFVIMPLIVWSAYCHLYSAWLKLPKKEMAKWSWLTRAFYPKRSALVVLIDCVMERLQTQGKPDVHNRRQK